MRVIAALLVVSIVGTAHADDADGAAKVVNAGGYVMSSTGDIVFIDGVKIRRVSGGTVATIAGTTIGASGDYGPATAAQLSSPNAAIVMPGGHIAIGESTNVDVRVIW